MDESAIAAQNFYGPRSWHDQWHEKPINEAWDDSPLWQVITHPH